MCEGQGRGLSGLNGSTQGDPNPASGGGSSLRGCPLQHGRTSRVQLSKEGGASVPGMGDSFCRGSDVAEREVAHGMQQFCYICGDSLRPLPVKGFPEATEHQALDRKHVPSHGLPHTGLLWASFLFASEDKGDSDKACGASSLRKKAVCVGQKH